MNENIDLTKILKDCPKGFKLYSPLFGEIVFEGIKGISGGVYPIAISYNGGEAQVSFTKEGFYYDKPGIECLLFPSKEQRNWSKFTAPWYKKNKFDPKTLKPFDKVLARDYLHGKWTCGFFSHIVIFDNTYMYNIGEILYKMCIPYNEETKHLVGTTGEAPEFYRYWEE